MCGAVRPLLPALFALALVILALPLSLRVKPAAHGSPNGHVHAATDCHPVSDRHPKAHAHAAANSHAAVERRRDRDALVALYHATGGPGWDEQEQMAERSAPW